MCRLHHFNCYHFNLNHFKYWHERWERNTPSSGLDLKVLCQVYKGLFECFFPWCILVGIENWLNKLLMLFFFSPDIFIWVFYSMLVAQSIGGGGTGMSWEALPGTGLSCWEAAVRVYLLQQRIFLCLFIIKQSVFLAWAFGGSQRSCQANLVAKDDFVLLVW